MNGRRVIFPALPLAILLAGLAVSACSDSHSPTNPIEGIRVAGTWTGHMTLRRDRESISVSVQQEGSPVAGADRVSGTWTSSRFGFCSFSGSLSGRTVAGAAVLEHVNQSLCSTSIKVAGTASATQWTLDGYQLCGFDPVPFRLELSR